MSVGEENSVGLGTGGLPSHLRPARARRVSAGPGADGAADEVADLRSQLADLGRRFDACLRALGAVEERLAAQERHLVGLRKGVTLLVEAARAPGAPDVRIDQMLAAITRLEAAARPRWR